jgi:hypothetical protein
MMLPDWDQPVQTPPVRLVQVEVTWMEKEVQLLRGIRMRSSRRMGMGDCFIQLRVGLLKILRDLKYGESGTRDGQPEGRVESAFTTNQIEPGQPNPSPPITPLTRIALLHVHNLTKNPLQTPAFSPAARHSHLLPHPPRRLRVNPLAPVLLPSDPLLLPPQLRPAQEIPTLSIHKRIQIRQHLKNNVRVDSCQCADDGTVGLEWQCGHPGWDCLGGDEGE